LLAAGARVNLNDEEDYDSEREWELTQPLHAALHNERCKGGNAKLVQVLIDAGADLEARDEDEETPLMLAAQANVDARTNVAALVAAGADLFAVDAEGKTARQLAEAVPCHGAWEAAEELRHAEEKWLHDAMEATGGPGPSGV
jgi:ankyrin repeat protein